MRLVLDNATCVTPSRTAENRTVVIEDGTIARVRGADHAPGDRDKVLDLEGRYVLPGFIDLHAHGIAGAHFSNPDFPVQEAVDILHSHGVTALYPTLQSRPWPEMKEALGRAARLCQSGPGRHLFRGLHCEGPFLNPEKSGAADTETLREPCTEGWQELQDAAEGHIHILTIAPELDGAMAVIRSASRDGVLVSAGHSRADYETMMMAVDVGLQHTTHLFNAMAHFHHRDPNILLAALLEPDIGVQLNAEGDHVHPLGMQMAYRLKGPQGIVLTSDLHPLGGLDAGTYEVEGEEVKTDGRLVRTADDTVAGSACPLDECIRTFVSEVGASLPEAARMASLNPARALRLDDRKGRVAEGYDADLVVMDENLQVTSTLSGGHVVYKRD